MAAIRWGILGTGRMAAQMATELRSLREAGAELVAVGSRSYRAAAAFAARFGITRPCGSYLQLAADREIDIVYVATPPSEHAAHMMLCLQSGKAVLCEKPFTTDAAQARQVLDLARQRGLFVMEAMWTRFLPAVLALRRLISERAVGRPELLVGGGAFVPAYDPHSYLFSSRLGGGVLLDCGVYLISLSSLLLGSVRAVHASGDIGVHGVDESNAFILDHAGGARALLYVSMRARRPPDLELVGEHGRIHVGAPVFRPTRLTLSRSDGGNEALEFPIEGSGYHYQIIAAMEAMRRGRLEVADMPWSETLSIVSVMDDIRRQLTPIQSTLEATPPVLP
jgi:predicted dehydrogenase